MPTLTGCLQTDHRRLDAILGECKELANAGRVAVAADRFATFERGLSRHIDAEEGVLFPVLAERASGAAAPIGVMRAEHREIRDLMAKLATAFAGSDPEWRSVLGDLEDVLSGHNMKEERMLYPMADEATSEAPGVDLVRARLEGVLAGEAPRG